MSRSLRLSLRLSLRFLCLLALAVAAGGCADEGAPAPSGRLEAALAAQGASRSPSAATKQEAALDAISASADPSGRVRVLLRLARGADRARVRAAVHAVGGRVAHEYRVLPDVVSVRELPLAALPGLVRAPGVEQVLPDQHRRALLQQSLPLMDADPASLAGYGDGSGVTVCVLDTGANLSHPALAPAIVADYDFVNDDADATDDDGHGTHVAGVVASRSTTYRGVAPGASLAIGKVLGPTGGYDSDIIAGIDWCTLTVQADVVNMSLGGGAWPGSCDFDALAQAVNGSVDLGVVHVIASGNEGELHRVASPGCASRAITVGAVYDAPLGSLSWCANASCSAILCTDSNIQPDQIVCFSNGSPKLSVLAPGSVITSADGFSSSWANQSGTSQATPHVAGLVARLLSEDPTLTPADVFERLARNARDLGAPGFDDRAGHGRVEALATLADGTPIACEGSADCADGDPCTADVCQSGYCVARASCDDGDACTADACAGGACSHTPVPTDDGLACTADSCDACYGPLHTLTGSPCNDTCAAALPIPVGPTVSTTTVGASKAYNTSCPGYSMAGADRVFKLRLRPDQPVDITVVPTSGWDPGIYLLMDDGSGAGCDVQRCVGGMDAAGSGGAERLERLRVPVEGDYYLVVDSYYSTGAGSFDLTVTAGCDPDHEGRPCDDFNACTFNDLCTAGVCEGSPAQSDVRVATWNLQAVGAPGTAEYDAALAVLERVGADVVAVNEIASTADVESFLALAEDAGYRFTLHPDQAGPFGALWSGFMSRHPILEQEVLGSADLSGDAAANDLTRLLVRLTLDVPGDNPHLTLLVNHWKSGTTNADEFRRVVESYRVAQAVADLPSGVARLVVMGDVNEELDNVPGFPDPFTAVPTGMPLDWVLGADLAAELAGPGLVNDPFHYLTRTDGPSLNPLDTLQLDGSDATRVASGRRLDYLLVSDVVAGLGAVGEIYDSADEGLPGGLPKPGAIPWSTASAEASDHLMVFLDVAYPGGCTTDAECDDGDACTDDLCALASGTCVHGVVTCDDGNACNGLEVCDPLAGCVAGVPLACSDGDACNGLETCDPASGCVAGTPVSCDDGNACTDDACDPASGGCGHGAVVCDDGSACNGAESCDPAAGCVPGTPLACDDGNACNGVEACNEASGCEPGVPLWCDDGDACNGAETCDPGAGCVPGTPPACDDDDACTVDTCDPASGACGHVPIACDDGDACNGGESCDPLFGCLPGTPLACGDGDACNGAESCDPAAGCVPGTPPSCDDGDACTVDGCDPATGCTHAPPACGLSDGCCVSGCGDPDCVVGPVCGNGVCEGGSETCFTCPGDCACSGKNCSRTCCGNGVCEPRETESACPVDCAPTPACSTAADCDDGNACTTDACTGGVCAHAPVSCDDGNACTADTCDPATGACAHVPVSCDDGDACTADACDPATGCSSTPPACGLADGCCVAGCSDPDCPTGPVCGDGVCAGGTETCFTCSADCGCSGKNCSKSCCGDGTCASNENANTCAVDCAP